MKEPPRLAELDEVQKFAEGLETETLVCRSSSHVWAMLTSSVRQIEDDLHWTTDCSQCGTVRTIIYTSKGYLRGRRYEYPEGYRRQGLGRIDAHGKALMRVAMFGRMVGD